MRDIAFVVYPGYSVMALAVVTAFEVANMLAEGAPYDLHFVSETGGAIKTSSGMRLESEAFTAMSFDTLVVGGSTVPIPSTPGLIAFMRDAPKRHRRVAAVCTGAFVLAEAGLLDGRHATTHWLHARNLQRQFPKVKMDEDRIFVNDGPIWTSAGMTAGIDLGLEHFRGADENVDGGRHRVDRDCSHPVLAVGGPPHDHHGAPELETVAVAQPISTPTR